MALEDLLKIVGSEPFSGKRLERPKPVLTQPEIPHSDDEDKMWEKGIGLFAREDFSPARKVFEKILADDSESAKGQVGLGLIFANMGKDDKARKACERAKELDELLPEIYFLQALLDEKDSRFKEAVKNYQRVLWLDPDYIIAYFNLGNLYLAMKRESDAIREFNNTLNLLKEKDDHLSLCFSGGMGSESLRRFCLEQVNNSQV
jgi:chemotaxis protein methyltransferase CheR